MNTKRTTTQYPKMPLIAAAVAAILLAACASVPPANPGAAEARSKLTRLQGDPDLATRAPAAIKEADLAVQAAEMPQTDSVLGAHLVYIADRKVDIAAAQARTKLAEDQRAALSQQRDNSRLEARTMEADKATARLEGAKIALAEERRAGDAARVEADAAHTANADAIAKSALLQQQLDDLQARPTDRGMVLTLGDVLFTTGQADLKTGATSNLSKLAAFLNNYPDRTVLIEGHTDSVGSSDYNIGLSQRRAESVKSYLTSQGISADRLTASGKGEGEPVTENESPSGRQQNRRVEVIISNSLTASR